MTRPARRGWIVTTICLSTLVAAACYFARTVSVVERDATTAKLARSGDAPASPVVPADVAHLPVATSITAPLSAGRSLAQSFSTSRNYREFIEAARKDVAHGGGAYALFTMMTCSYVNETLRQLRDHPRPPAEDSREIMARTDARALLEGRCATVGEPEYSALAYSRDLRTGGDPVSDPLFRIWRASSGSIDLPGGRRQVIQEILDAQDPLLVARMNGLLDVDWKTRTAYFDGQVYRVDEEPALSAAASLLECSIGFDCTAANDTNLAITCLVYTVCQHDRFALVKLQADAQGYPFAKVMDFHDRMVSAYRQKRVEVFVRPT